jgi:hypothetical protein
MNPELRDLLDHVARQLAEEYVRLMRETTAEAGNPSAQEAVSR